MGNKICNIFLKHNDDQPEYKELQNMDEIVQTRYHKYININITRKVKQQLRSLGLYRNDYILLDYIISNTFKNEKYITKKTFSTDSYQYEMEWKSPEYYVKDKVFACVFTSSYVNITRDDFRIDVLILSIEPLGQPL